MQEAAKFVDEHLEIARQSYSQGSSLRRGKLKLLVDFFGEFHAGQLTRRDQCALLVDALIDINPSLMKVPV